MINTYNGDFIQILIVEGHYDPEDYNDPIKYRINLDYSNTLALYGAEYTIMRVQRNVVNMLDGSTRTFYTTKISYQDVVGISYYNFFGISFILNHEYIQYDQYIDYQISPTTRRLNSETSDSNENLMPSYYFVFFVLAQYGGLYTFLHLAFGLFMNRWTEQHLKQAFVSELYSSLESKNQQRNQALDQQPERYRGSRVVPENRTPNIGLNVSHNNEQFPLMNEQSAHMNNGVNLHNINNHQNENYRNDESQIPEFENYPFNPNYRRHKKKAPEFAFNYKDTLYGMFCCPEEEGIPDMVTLKGRQTLLNYQFSILAYQREAITMLDNLTTLREEIQSIEK